MTSQECERLPDHLPCDRTVFEQVERVRRGGVIRECDRQVVREGRAPESVQRGIEAGGLILAGAGEEKRDVREGRG
jgi:hypothetical protein